MSFVKSIAAGLGLALATAFGIVMVGFIAQADIEIPGVVRITSGSDSAPQSSLMFNPIAVIVLALVLGFVIWFLGRSARPGSGEG